mmetsp:Transcript_37660/g.33675  ORF Transcript_37660/g.33675 Transcript_37660/m.33675 type:complete len:101 (-) Transcript_37660:282-584(-)
MNDAKNANTNKVDRKLYLGNLAPGMSAPVLQELLNNALQRMGVNTDKPGNSIINTWVSPDGHYAFIDFRTPEECTNGFALSNVAIHGQTLKVGRPKAYQQ